MKEEYKYYILAKASVIFQIFLVVIKVLQMQRFGKTVCLPHLSNFPIPNNLFTSF